MKLLAVTVQKFRNFVEPQRIEIEPNVTALVGKNESGKTTILKALHRLRPANGSSREFALTTEYPRWRLSKDRRDNAAIKDTQPVIAEFSLDPEDIAELNPMLPAPLLSNSTVFASRSYSNDFAVWVETPLVAVIREAADDAAVNEEDLDEILKVSSLDEAITKAKSLASQLEQSEPARAKAIADFPAIAASYRFLLGRQAPLEGEHRDALIRRIPKFFYFSNYSVLPGEADLNHLADSLEGNKALDPKQQAVVSLLAHAGVTPQDLLDPDYESRKAELQAASGELTREVFKYWRANTDLEVVFDDDNVAVQKNNQSSPSHHRKLKIELKDLRHGGVETNFSTRSTGFQWFFSFFAAFSKYLNSNNPVIVLLDEPGMSLHGEAQRDFVNYIFNELGASKQTLYTTHSQFMIDPTVYETIRAVHDRATREDHDAGVVVSSVDLAADRDTVLPIESALGYSISQHLFIGSGHHLLVEGSSDLIFIMRMSAYLEAAGRTSLNPYFSMIPVGGINNMPAFVALMGRRLEVSVLVDGEKTSSVLDRTRNAAKANSIPLDRIISVGEINSTLPRNGDVEDLFAVSDYLRLYGWAFGKDIREADLAGTGRILERIESVDGKFSHARPAHVLTERQEEFFQDLHPDSCLNFEKLFTKLNEGLELRA